VRRGLDLTPRGKWEYLRRIYERYRKGAKAIKGRILDEFCEVTRYHRKYATLLLNGPRPEPRPPRRRHRTRKPVYAPQVIAVLAAIWEASGYPWSVRLKALLPLWLPWAKKRFAVSAEIERRLLQISPRQIDRRLADHKRRAKRRLYGRTKPGTLLKHHIPIKTDHWDVRSPGFTEIDLVSHSGDKASGEFIYRLNLTDIHTAWVETRAVMGKGQVHVQAALHEIREVLPFALRGIDSDNGSEFINRHLARYCSAESIQFTRGRPYKKDDNAHIEQKNWTHVRKLLGWERYDSEAALAAINKLYIGELRLLQNLFQPSVKLRQKQRVGSRLVRRYDAARTPLDRVIASAAGNPKAVAELVALRARLDPFALSAAVDRQLERVYSLANRRHSPKTRAGAMEAAGPVDAPTDARPQAFPQGLGKRFAFPTAPTARTETEIRSQQTKKVTKVIPLPPTPCRAKPVDGSSKNTRGAPPTGFRRLRKSHRTTARRNASSRSARVRFLVARRSRAK
jgi:hypothetical protein